MSTEMNDEELIAQVLSLANRNRSVILARHVASHLCHSADNPVYAARRLLDRLTKKGLLVRKKSVADLDAYAVTPLGSSLAESFGMDVPHNIRWGINKRGVKWAPPPTYRHDIRGLDFVLSVEQLYRQSSPMLAHYLRLTCDPAVLELQTATEHEISQVTSKAMPIDPFPGEAKKHDALVWFGGVTYGVEVEGAPKMGEPLRKLAESIVRTSQSNSLSMIMPTERYGEIVVKPELIVLVLPHLPPVRQRVVELMRFRIARAVIRYLQDQLRGWEPPDDFTHVFRDNPNELPRGFARFLIVRERGVGTFDFWSTELCELRYNSNPERWFKSM